MTAVLMPVCLASHASRIQGLSYQHRLLTSTGAFYARFLCQLTESPSNRLRRFSTDALSTPPAAWQPDDLGPTTRLRCPVALGISAPALPYA